MDTAPLGTRVAPWSLEETLVRLGDRSVEGRPPVADVPGGDAVAGRYLDRGTLGQGGMGRVADVFDAHLGRRVALKTLAGPLATEAEARQRFIHEAQVQAQLDHPAVVPVHDFGRREDGAPWFTMRRVCGRTLAEIIAAAAREDAPGRPSRRRMLGWFVQACLAVEFAHSRQVLHLDFKPGNVMVGEFGEVYVLDWGLARSDAEGQGAPSLEAALEAASCRPPIAGTPGYLSPERLRGAPPDAADDVYALGCTLFELLALEPMHRGTTLGELVSPLSPTARSPRLRAPAQEVPEPLDAAVVAATDPDRARRTRSARALAEAVERFLDDDRHSESLRLEARTALSRAQAATARLKACSDATREHVISDLARVLSLEPELPEAQALLHQVVHSEPARLPAGVAVELQRSEGEERAQLARASAVRLGTWVLLAPLFWLMGARDVSLAGTVTLGVVAAFLTALVMARSPSLSARSLGALVATHAAALAGVSLVFGSLMLVPSLAASAAVLYAGHLRGRSRVWAVVAMTAAVMGPLALEFAGVLPPSMRFEDGALQLLPRLTDFPPAATVAVLVVSTLASLVTPAVLGGHLRDRLARAESRLQLMAWYLEHLGARGSEHRGA